jgi:HAE1 family hydrophobic/amphiphilic exporter-1
LTTFFGVLPMALTTGGGSEVYAPLGQAIAGGLVSSTLITLVIIPVLYYLSARHIERRE